MKLIDEIIDKKLGLTSYAFRIYIIIALFFLADGGEMIIESLLITKLGVIWQLSHSQKGFLGSAVFVGFFLGAMISGKLSDTLGRRPIFIAGAIITAVFAVVSALSPNYYFLLIIRAFFGSGVGMSIPACSSLAVEITPSKYRAWVMNLVWIFFPVGEIFSVLVASYILNKENGWRWLLAVVGVPATVTCILSFFVNESPRFYLGTKQFDKAFINLNRILEYAEEKIELSEEMKDRIIAEETDNEGDKIIKSNFSTLCEKDYARLTIQTCVIFFICSFCYYGFVFILPQLMQKHSSETQNMNSKEADSHMYHTLIYSALAEVPSVFISSLISNVSCLGRIRSMALGLFLSIISAILSACFLSYIIVFAAFFKFAINMPFSIIYVYACEAFPTKIRSIAIGVTNSFTRLGGILTPIITQLIFSVNIYGPFITFAVTASAGLVCALLLPFETLGRIME